MNLVTVYKLPLTCAASEEYLQEIRCTLTFMKLYHEIFPEKWEKAIQRSDTFTATQRVAIAEEFLELVEEELFEIGWGAYGYDLVDAMYCIPFYPIDLNILEEFEEYEGGRRFLAELYLGEIEGVTDASRIDWDELHRLCDTQAMPLCHLYNALCMFDRTTENVWFDACSENYYEFEWSLENVSTLAEKWTQAMVLQTNFDELIEWIDEEPTAREQVLSFWQQIPSRKAARGGAINAA